MNERSADPTVPPSLPFRVAFVPGVTLGKWTRIWEQRMPRVPLAVAPTAERDQLAVLREGSAEMSFVRRPVDREGINVIPLYYETPVVVVPKDHVVAAYDEVTVADLADEHLLQDPDGVPEWRDLATEVQDGTRAEVGPMTFREAMEVVANGGGIVIVPKSVARLHARKDVTSRPVTGVAESRVGLAWLADATDPRIDIFIGIVRGRTERSSRAGPGPSPQNTGTEKAAKKPAATKGQRSVVKRASRGGRASGSGGGGRRQGGRR